MSVNDGVYNYDRPVAPTRPDVDDLGGNQHVDDDTNPDPTEPNAAAHNEQTNTLAGLVRVGPLATLWVEWNGSAYNIIKVTAMGTTVNAATFTVDRASAGNVTISWGANKLPPLEAPPKTGRFGSAPGTVTGDLNNLDVNSVLIYCRDDIWAYADLSFWVELH